MFWCSDVKFNQIFRLIIKNIFHVFDMNIALDEQKYFGFLTVSLEDLFIFLSDIGWKCKNRNWVDL